MKISNKHTAITKKRLILAVLAMATLVVGLFVYIYAFNGSFAGWSKGTNTPLPQNTVNTGASSSDQKSAGDAIKQNVVAPNENDNTPPTTSAPTTSPVESSVVVTITAANQNGSTYQLRALISALVTTGACTLSLSNAAGVTVTKTAAVQPQASTSTCQGFDIPLSELSPGTWTASLTFTNATLEGSATKTIAVQ